MASELPVVFLAFANALDDHLATLKEESRDVFRVLQPLEKEGRIDIHREESSEFDELYQDLLTYGDRLVIFHYGGHADGTILKLEGGAAGAAGIAGLLGQQSSLKLVFLNGCATKDQVKLLHAAGVPAVIATAVEIGDSRATQFSTAFYGALAEGRNIFEAFDLASNYIEGKLGAKGGSGPSIKRSPNYKFGSEEQDVGSDIFEWTLYAQEHAAEDLAQWRLPEAREGWQTQLEDSRGAIRTVAGEPLLIEHRARSRTIDVLLCRRCGTASSNTGAGTVACPVCNSEDTGRGVARTAIPDLFLPGVLSEEDARAGVIAALEDENPHSIHLQQVYLPYWLFDVDTHTTLAAERGVVRAFDADALELEWENVQEEIDLAVDDFLVPAGRAPAGRDDASAHWYWQLDNAVSLQQLESSTTFVPLEQSIEAGFSQVSSFLSGELEAEATDRVGGHQQRNVSTDMRYKKVAARTVLLPHWYATVDHEHGHSSILVNGQTGAVRFPRVTGMQALKNESNTTMSKNIFETGARQEKISQAISIFSGVGIGVMVGLLMGLAAPAGPEAKTVVGIFIGAVGVGLAALLGLNDRHFSNAKGLRIGSFGLAVAVSALSGIYVRDHGLVSPGLEERAAEIRHVFKGIKDGKVIEMLAAMDSNLPADARQTDGGGQKSIGHINLRSMQYSGVTADKSVCEKLQGMRDEEVSTKMVLRNFRFHDKGGKLGWKNLADEAEKKMPEVDPPKGDLKKFLLISRDVICGGEQFEKGVALTGEQCAAIGEETPDWRILFSSNNTTAAVLKLVDESLSPPAQLPALQLLGPALCPGPEGEQK